MDPSYNNSFGMPVQPPIADSGGKKKKAWMIFGVVFAIIAVGLIVFFAVFAKNGGVKIGSNSKEKYLNYLVNGDTNDGTDVGTEYSGGRNYYLVDAIYAEDAQAAYFDGAVKLLENIKISSSDDESGDENMQIAEQKAMLNMFKSYNALSNLGVEGIANLYLSSGYETVANDLISEIQSFSGDMNEYTNLYAKNALGLIDGLMKVVDIYKSVGCGGDSLNILAECQLLEDSPEYVLLYDKNSNCLYGMEESVAESIPYFLNLAYSLGGVNE
ncbi:hypothetical protein IKD57_02530 [Candidatus Saccharibacteria bacterium]|nr:hypothetical protein [Candidatus Saccharibacteria bacterium]